MFKTIISCFLYILILQGKAQKANENKILVPYRVKNLWGFSDTLGNIKISPCYTDVKDFTIDYNNNFSSCYLVKNNKKYYIVDNKKNVLIPETNPYDSISLNHEHPNYFWVYKNGKVGLFYKNKEIIACLYDWVKPTINESYRVSNKKLQGLINSEGKQIIPLQYLDIMPLWNDDDTTIKEFVWRAKGLLIEDKFYDKWVEPPYKSDFSFIKTEVKEAEKISFENVISRLEKKYDTVKQFFWNKNYALVSLNKKRGIVSLETEEEVLKPIYNDAQYFATDYGKDVYKVKLNEMYGLLKEGNKIILPIAFEKIEYNSTNKVYLIESNNKQGCIVFNTIYPYIKPKYLSIKKFENITINESWQFGIFEVKTESGKGYIGENGVDFFKN